MVTDVDPMAINRDKPPKGPATAPFESKAVKRILLKGGILVEVELGSYREMPQRGGPDLFVAKDESTTGKDELMICGPASEVTAVWFLASAIPDPGFPTPSTG